MGLCTGGEEDLEDALACSRLFRDLDPSSVSERWSCAASVRRYERVAGPDWIAVGNAAFAPDPLSGGGLWFALYTAGAAAEVVARRSSIAGYQAEIDMQIHTHLESQRALLVDESAAVAV